jgi:hypothetical protein
MCVLFFVSFMKESKGQSYTWPYPQDALWLDFSRVIVKITPPVPTGRFQRAFKLDGDSADLIKLKFAERMGKPDKLDTL